MEDTQTSPAPSKSKGGLLWFIVIIIVIVGGFLLLSEEGGELSTDGELEGEIVLNENGEGGIVLDEVIIPEGGGFVVVYETNDDGTRTTVGQSVFLPAGTHTNVTIAVKRSLNIKNGRGTNERAAKYLAVAHADTDGDGEFSEETDGVLVDEDGEEISEEIVFEDEEADDTEDTDVSDDSNVDENDSDDNENIVVFYSDEGFSPKNVTIRQGRKVVFVNKGSLDMWVGSAMHPTHEVYDGTSLNDHCPNEDSSAFDQCEVGLEYSFTFDQVGEWGYHNHSHASHFGKVIVE